jgi:hypothetical protein
MIRHQGLHQILPMRGEARGAKAAHRRQILVTLLVIRDREHLAVGGKPFGTLEAMAGALLPVRRVGTAETIHRVLHSRRLSHLAKISTMSITTSMS